MIDMIGVGPFITIPLIIGAMGGPQAMLGWILGAIFALCDGMVWAELGAAMPGSGGSYKYLKTIYGPDRLGRLLSFIFIWQLSFSAPLSIASGCVGLAQYAAYLWPGSEKVLFSHDFSIASTWLGGSSIHVVVSTSTFIAVGACLLAVLLLYRKITGVAWLSKALWIVVLATMAWIIFAGLTHFSAAQAFDFPAGAFHLDNGFFIGLGAAMLIATYDYWGYYNVCFLGDEVQDPARNIPRAVLYSILGVAVLYITMNISILGVLPWRDLQAAARSGTHFYVASLLMQKVYGSWAAQIVTVLIMWAAFASVFSLLAGYSRVPYAAALDGNYFKAFAHIHPKYRFPDVSLLALGGFAVLFCFLRLADIIAALVVIRILIQFLPQAVGLILFRLTHPEAPRPFRMWLYPIPALLAIPGFTFVLFERPNFLKEVGYAGVILISGLLIYFIRAWQRREWPLADAREP